MSVKTKRSGFGKFKLTEESTLAGELMLGSESMEITLNMTVVTVWVGNHRSSGNSPLIASSPGGCKMEMQTLPSLYTV